MKHSNSCLYECRVFHRRYIRADTRFQYRIFTLLIDLDELPALDRGLRLFGWNRWRPIAFYDRDHFRWQAGEADRAESAELSLRARVERYLRENGADDFHPARILLVTNPRVLGYVFNPVSFYYCYDDAGRLRAILSEVNNTYLEQKPFLHRVAPEQTGDAALEDRRLKNFYVSPFIAHDTDFYFRFEAPGSGLRVRIDSMRGPQRILKAVVHGERRALNDRSLLSMMLRYPFVTLKIIAAIHWQALRLFIKKIYVHDKVETDKKIRELKKEREVAESS